MEPMLAARFNIYWFLSIVAPAVVMLGGSLLAPAFYLCCRRSPFAGPYLCIVQLLRPREMAY